MKEIIIYLAGAVKNMPDEGSQWRREATNRFLQIEELSDIEIAIINPTKYFTYSENKHKTQKQVKEFYLNKILNCDLVLCNCDYSDSSIGTAQEIQYAVDHNIPVIGFGTKNTYPWITEVDCQVVFDTMDKAIEYIANYYLFN